MAHAESREVVLLGLTTVTTSGTGSVINVPMGYSGVLAHANLVTASGTSPTLNVYIQNQFTPAASGDTVPNPPTGTVKFQDLISFTQLTTSGTVAMAATQQNGTFAALQQDAALTAGSVNNGPIGSAWRVKYVVGGTNPSLAFSVSALLVPEG